MLGRPQETAPESGDLEAVGAAVWSLPERVVGAVAGTVEMVMLDPAFVTDVVMLEGRVSWEMVV